MKRIVVVSAHYDPETGAAAQRVTALASALKSHGWDVVVVTQLPNYPRGRIFDGYEDMAATPRNEHGITVIRLRPRLVPRQKLAMRLVAEVAFCLAMAPKVLRLRPTVVLASSPYMFLGPLGLIVAKAAGSRFVWDVRDLTWLYPRAAGIRTYGIDRVLERVMLIAAKHSHALLTATEGLMTYFVQRPAISVTVPNGVSPDWLAELVKLPPPDPAVRRVLYAGLFGFNHSLSTVVEAAALLPSVQFTLVGDGPERDKLETRAAELGLSNLSFLGYVTHTRLLDEYSKASILVSHVRSDPVHRWAQPAKLWEYMATGRPVVHAGEGEAVAILEANRLCLTVPPENPGVLARAIASLLEDPLAARTYGERGRTFAVTHRSREALLERAVTAITAASLR